MKKNKNRQTGREHTNNECLSWIGMWYKEIETLNNNHEPAGLPLACFSLVLHYIQTSKNLIFKSECFPCSSIILTIGVVTSKLTPCLSAVECWGQGEWSKDNDEPGKVLTAVFSPLNKK